VARRAEDVDTQVAGLDDITVGQPFGAEAMRRIERADVTPGLTGEPGRSLGVIGMPVGEQDQVDPARGGEYGAQVLLQERTGVDDDRRLRAGPQDPGVGALERHRARVRREDAAGPRCHSIHHDPSR
jgi:hypothetical protein